VLLGAVDAVVLIAAVLSVNGDEELILDGDCDVGELNTVLSDWDAVEIVAKLPELVEEVLSDKTATVGIGKPKLLRA
jgi:hypothetical protein